MSILQALQNTSPSSERFFEIININLHDEKTTSGITWYGRRIIEVKGEGRISLNKFTNKIVAEIRDHRRRELNQDFEDCCYSVIRTLDRFYEETDAKIAQSWFFVRIFAALQDFSILWMLDPKGDIEQLSIENEFDNVYTRLSGWWWLYKGNGGDILNGP